MTMATKRRAVFTVLSQYVSDDALWQIMWRWQNKFADKAQFELNGFLSECKDIKGVAENRAQLYRQLIGIMMDRHAVLKPDPLDDMLVYQAEQVQRGNMQDSGVVNWTQSFSTVLKAIFQNLRSDTARHIKQFASEQAVRNPMSAEFVYAFTLWEPTQLLHVEEYDVSDLRRLLNIIYIGMCEYLGPVEADRILSAGIREAAASNRQPATDPRQLL